MQYMLLVYLEESALSDPDREICYVKSAELTQELHAEGSYIAASPLQPTATATTLRIRDKKRILTDGPFAETREQLGGYFLVEAKDLDEAIRIAARIPGAQFGSIEIRPLLQIAGLPESH